MENKCLKCNKPIEENYYSELCDPNTKPKLFVINPNIDDWRSDMWKVNQLLKGMLGRID